MRAGSAALAEQLLNLPTLDEPEDTITLQIEEVERTLIIETDAPQVAGHSPHAGDTHTKRRNPTSEPRRTQPSAFFEDLDPLFDEED
jgi:hypothetical protein